MFITVITTNIYFNKQCLTKNVTPKYAQIKIPNTSPASLNTSKKIQMIRIKEEIQFLVCCVDGNK
jgi:hypothetical protein